MLSGCSPRALPRGIVLLRHSHNARLQVNSYAHRPLLRLQGRRYYGRILRSIISKHTSTISNALRPVFPASFSDQLSRKNVARTNTPATGHYTGYSSRTAESPVELEDDAASEIQRAPLAETDIQDRVRQLMRQVPHPVAIITSTDPNSPEKTAFRGMTVSSFNTVTLYPEPVVSFNAKVPSGTYNAIVTSSRFLVHLLAPNEVTARVAREFSKGHENVSPDGEHRFFQFTSPSSRQNPPAIRSGEPPRLVMKQDQNAPSTKSTNFPFIFECLYLPQSCRVGDHVVVLGTVVKVFQDESATGSTLEPEDTLQPSENEQLCLTYADARFWRIGQAVVPRSES